MAGFVSRARLGRLAAMVGLSTVALTASFVGLVALATGSGDQQWATDAVSTMKSPTVSGDRLYVSDYSGVTVLAASDGSEVFAVDLGSSSRSSPVMVGGGLAVGSDDGILYGIT